jgi:hypothetical protein
MMLSELNNHQIWHNLTEIAETLDADTLIQEHLELSNFKVFSYWDEYDRYYEEVILPRAMKATLVSSSIGINHKERFLQMRFSLTHLIDTLGDDDIFLGELLLIYNQNLEFKDENWYLNIESPFIIKMLNQSL